MTKITLNDLSTISGNEQSAINLINANNAVIETASDNTLSRDGTSPNQMLSSLDMNSFRILNLSDAINVTEPVTYGQLLSLITGSGVPITSSYVTLGTDSILPNERVLTAGTGITLTDGGAGSTITISSSATPTGAALTKVDDTNITLTLGGTPTTALLQATSITAGWTGTLSAARGGTGLGSLGTGIATWLGTPSSANLASAITDETGTGSLVFGTSPTLTTATLTTPTMTAPVLGTPSSGTLTNCTGLPVSTGISGLGAGVTTFLATPTSANLATAVTNETGTGSLVFGTSPGFTTAANPISNGGAALGISGTAWSNLFLASGAVIDFNASDVTITHSSPNVLTFAGASSGYNFDSTINASTLTVSNYITTSAPSTQTTDFNLSAIQNFIICNKGSTLTITLPSAASFSGRSVWIKTLQAFTVVSAASNVCPNTTNTPGTAILPATAGAWCLIVSDGTNWIRMASSTIA